MVNITFTNEREIHEIVSGLIERTLPRERWTHAAHLAAAIGFLSMYQEGSAFDNLAPAIRAYNEASGVRNTDTSGFHYTITKASLIAAKSVVDCNKGRPLHLVTNSLISSRFGKKEWVHDFWSHEVLFSPRARREWVEPDIARLKVD